MKRTSAAVIAAIPIFAFALPGQQAFKGPAQAARGFELFTKTAKPLACATCHSIGGKTPTAGPDLRTWGRMSPRATAGAISATLTAIVLAVELKQGGTFPAMKVKEEGGSTEYFDLSKTPPELRTVAGVDVVSVKPNSTWKHPPGTVKNPAQDIADLIAYIRYAANGDGKQISPDDVE